MATNKDACLGDMIHNLRRRKGWTQQQLAERIGTNYSHISKWERGDHIPSEDYLPKLSEALSVPLDIIKRQIIIDRQKDDDLIDDSYSSYSATKKELLRDLQAAEHFIHKAIEQLKDEEDM